MTRLPTLFVFCCGLLGANAGADGSGSACDLILVDGVHVTHDPGVSAPTGVVDEAKSDRASRGGSRRVTFRSRFEVTRTATDAGAVLPFLADVIRDWAIDRRDLNDRERAAVAGAWRLAVATEAPYTRITIPHVNLEFILSFDRRGRRDTEFRLLVIVPDRRRPDQEWRTSVSILARAGAPGVDVSIQRAVARTGPDFVRGAGPVARPSLIDRLLDDPTLNLNAGLAPLTRDPLLLRTRDVPKFVDAVRDPNRTQPLIYLSGGAVRFSGFVDATRLAKRLAGFAAVVVEDPGPVFDAWPVTQALRDTLGYAPARNGAVRMFGPGGADWGTYTPGPKVANAVILDEVVRFATGRFLAARGERAPGPVK